MRASISDIRVRGESLDFRYTLHRVELLAPYLFRPDATLRIRYLDAKGQPVGREKYVRFAVDGAFRDMLKPSMCTAISILIPAQARYFSVELSGFGLSLRRMVLPPQTGKE
jgi:hypothetical protein